MNTVPGGRFPIPAAVSSLLSRLPPPECFHVRAYISVRIRISVSGNRKGEGNDKHTSSTPTFGPFCLMISPKSMKLCLFLAQRVANCQRAIVFFLFRVRLSSSVNLCSYWSLTRFLTLPQGILPGVMKEGRRQNERGEREGLRATRRRPMGWTLQSMTFIVLDNKSESIPSNQWQTLKSSFFSWLLWFITLYAILSFILIYRLCIMILYSLHNFVSVLILYHNNSILRSMT